MLDDMNAGDKHFIAHGNAWNSVKVEMEACVLLSVDRFHQRPISMVRLVDLGNQLGACRHPAMQWLAQESPQSV